MLLFTLTGIALTAATLGIVVRRYPKEIDLTTTAPEIHSTVTPKTLADAITIDQMSTHLDQLQKIANLGGGTRAIGTAGFNNTLDYITTYLTQNTNLLVKRQYFNVSTSRLASNPILISYLNNQQINYTYQTNFTLMTNSGSANFGTGVRVTVIPDIGCAEDNWLAASGTVALVKRGCNFVDVANFAAKSGVVGLMIYNDGADCDRYATITGASVPSNTTYPALFLSYPLGLAPANAAQNTSINTSVVINVAYISARSVGNICADTLSGDPTKTIVVGSHSDGVLAGSGINDNGSGSVANLVLATNLARLFQTSTYETYPYRVRFCWWGAEEVGLLGSYYHVEQAGLSSIVGERLEDYLMYFNYDMLGSPNFFFGIYDGNRTNPLTTLPQAINGSIKVSELFRDWFISQRLPWDYTAFGGGSDYVPFLRVGIVSGGLFSGAGGLKPQEQRDRYDQMLGRGQGGVPGTPTDPCYHRACDTVENINPFGYLKMVQAAAHVLELIARRDDLKTWLYPSTRHSQLDKSSLHKLLNKNDILKEFDKETGVPVEHWLK
ncbi:unnamed protein product [Didymodactylos carnosus]|uniref:Peptide hydrolase n=1 Tax=Didymodactylos carnosus TaxID=1234261 RepID=A0A814CQB6_9BILA|nr:unnamed protein product [Didymodactylos carnosus]CAF3719657.1 unnamed protein product [Didymodactylos carnosus]